jgi:DNA-binding response OmpR family regulator
MGIDSLLHVEDDEGAAFLFRLALREVGFTGSVSRVTNGEDALLFLRKLGRYQDARTPCLVVLDLNIPIRDGWSVLADRRGDAMLEAVPIVVLSTAPAHTNEHRAIASGAMGYMEKGRTFAAVLKQVQIIVHLLDQHDARAAVTSEA